MKKQDLINYINKNIYSIHKVMKRDYPNLFNKINKIDAKSFRERCFIYVYGYMGYDPFINKPTKFISFKNGYAKYYSNKSQGLNKDQYKKRNKKSKQTLIKKYGVDHPSKMKDHIKKVKQTKKERYGDENFVNIEKAKQTKKERYGNKNWNNREKAINTMINHYGTPYYTGLKEKTSKLANDGTIGFKSKKYKEYLVKNNITNISQLESVKEKKYNKKLQNTYKNILENYSEFIEPLFTLDEFNGGGYNNLYSFKCTKCGNEFKHWIANGIIPRCDVCYPKYPKHSKYENEIKEFLLKYLNESEIIINDRSVITPKELDVYIPSKKLAIEFNDIYWHSELNGKYPSYHLEKTELCESKGIKLLQIFESEWIYKSHIVKNIIKQHINDNMNETIYARKCNIKQINNNIKNEFLEKNHLQGKDNSSIKYGLFYNDELISVMTFSKARFNKNIEWEIYRYSTKLGYNIVGGASKLFNHFIKDYNPKSIITYSDRRYFNGNVYKQLGFNFIENTQPNYFYFNKNSNYILENRIKYQKFKLKNILPKYDDKLTEWENMQLNDYNRIWDCGNKKFIWNN